MPPSIVITEPVPRWRVWAQFLFKALLLLLLCAASFYAGMRYQALRPLASAATPPVVAASSVESQPAVSSQEALAAPSGAPTEDLLAARSIEGLRVQSLRVMRDGGNTGQLLYEFELVNGGRLFEGRYGFLFFGLQDGRPQQWVFPPEGQPSGGSFRMRVASYVKTSGRIQLPPGLQAQAVVLHLQESAGLRASRGLALAEGAAAPVAPLSGQ
jgi:hypothetical protein